MNDPAGKPQTKTLAGAGAAPFVAIRLRQEWEKGERPDVAEFLRRQPKVSPNDRIAALRVDQEMRREIGAAESIESYLNRFPEVAANLEHTWQLIQNEYLLRRHRGELPLAADYETRFPEFRVRLQQLHGPSSDDTPKQPLPSQATSSLGTVGFLSGGGDSVPTAHPSAFGPLLVPGYDIVEQIGRGSMGVIFKARSLRLKRLVALKMVVAGDLSRPEHLARFRSEAETVARLQHPNIVQIFEVGETAGRPFLVLEYLDGGALSTHLAGKPIAPRDAAQLLLTLADAMAHAHAQGIVHRDLKPGNVLLSHSPSAAPHATATLTHSLSWSGSTAQKTGPPFVPKIADFGLAKCIEDVSSQTQTGEILGTPSYMSPEQAAGANDEVGPPADVHALGAMLYEMLTGRPPFQGATPLDTVLLVKTEEPVPPTRLQPRLPSDLETICLKCLQKEPARRYAHAGALAEDLRRFLAGDPIHARPTGAFERAFKWISRNPAYATLLFVLVGGSVAFFANTFFYNRQLQSALASEGEQRQLAQEKERQALQAAAREAVASASANRQLVKLLLANGVRQLDEGDVTSALVWLSDALAAEKTTADDWDPVYLQREKMQRIRLASLLQECPRLTQYWLFGNAAAISRFSRDGTKAIVASANNAVRILDSQTGLAEQVVEIPGAVDRIADVSSDGTKAVALLERFKRLRVLDLSAKPAVARDMALPHESEIARFHPDGQTVALGSSRGLAVLDLKSFRIRQSDAAENPVHSLTYSADGGCIAAATDRRSIAFFDSSSLKLIGPPAPLTIEATHLAFRLDRKAAAYVHGENEVWIWDIELGKQVVTPMKHASPVNALAYSPDGMRLAVGCRDGQVVIWSARHSRRVQTLRHRGKVTSLCYSPDGTMLLSASADQTAVVWDWLSGRQAISPLRHGGGSVLGAAFASDGRRILTHASDGAVRVWDLAAAVADQSFAHRGAKLRTAHFSPKDDRIVTVADDGVATVFDRAGAGKKLFELPNESKVLRVEYSPDGNRVATRGDDGQARVFDARTGAALSSAIFVRNNQIGGISWDSSGRNLLFNVAYGFNIYSVVEQRDLARVGALETSTSTYFLPDRKSALNMAVLWGTRIRGYATADLPDINNPPLLYKIELPVDVMSLAISEKAGTFALACSDGIARQFDWRTGKPTGGLGIRHGSAIGPIAYSQDGRKLATGSDDGTAVVWSARTGLPVTPVLTHSSGVRRLQFSHDGAYLLTLSDDKTARVWDADSGLPVTAPIDPGETNWTEFSSTGYSILTACDDGIARIRNLQTADRSSDELMALAQLLSGLKLQGSLGLSPIAAPDIEKIWLKVRTDYPKYARVQPVEAAAWHRASADDAAADKLWVSAEFHLRRLLEFEPQSPTIKLRLADVLVELGKSSAALAMLDELAASGTSAKDVLRKRAFLHSRIGTEAAALVDLTRILALPAGKDDPVAGMARSVILAWQGKSLESRASFEQVREKLLAATAFVEARNSNSGAWRSLIDEFLDVHIKDRPNDAQLLRVRAVAHWALGRWDLAIADLRKFASLETAMARDWFMLAASANNLRRFADALEACERGVRLDGKFAPLWRLKGNVHLAFRPVQLEPAAESFEKAAALAPESDDWQRLGNIYFQLRNANRAAEAYEKAMRGAPPRYEIGYYLALAQLAAKQESGYRRTCRELLQAARNPEAQLDRNTVGWVACLGTDGADNYDEVVRLVAAEVDRSNDKYPMLNTLGAAYWRAGKADLAVETLMRAIAANGNGGSAWDWYLLAAAEASRGRAAEAKKYFDKAEAWVDDIRNGKLPSAAGANPNVWENQIELAVLRTAADKAIRDAKLGKPAH